jgi:hypothetical protein
MVGLLPFSFQRSIGPISVSSLCNFCNSGVEYTQLLVPFEIKNEVLKKMHNSVMSGHLGKKKTKGKLSQRYYWYEMREDLSIREQTTS